MAGPALGDTPVHVVAIAAIPNTGNRNSSSDTGHFDEKNNDRNNDIITRCNRVVTGDQEHKGIVYSSPRARPPAS